MDPSRQLIIVLSFSYILLYLSSVITIAQPAFMHYWCRMDVGNYTTNSTYQSNLNSLLSSFASNTQVDYGFYNLSVGQTAGPDEVNGLAICRGDVELHDCRGCVINSTRKILQICPYQKDAIGVYDLCILRYSNRSILGAVEELPAFYIRSNQNASDVNEFNQALGSLMNRLRSSAASGNSLRKFATGSEMAGFTTIFGLVQCTPDLSDQQCNNCLIGAIGQIVGGMVSERITKPSCCLQYDYWPFFGSTVPLTPPSSPPMSPQAPLTPPPPTTEGKKTNKARIILIIVVPILVSIVVFIISIWVGLRARTETKGAVEEDVDEIESPKSLQFTFDTIKVATEGFSEHNMLGQGGFGPVYKGTLANGQKIAVKRLSKGSVQGDLEFKNEVLLVAKLQHRNLVRLLGFCLQGIERLLIYEFVPNASLDKFIYDPIRRIHLYWRTRYKIICGIAKGLLYLHEDSRLRIIHRDLKASNILLDQEMNPKISDFGMARLFVVDQSQDRTSRVVGTYGYMAPEYAMQGQISVKSDVFSFGVLVLEIVCGKKHSSRCGDNVEHLLSYAWRRWREGTALDLIDPILRTNGSTTKMMRCIQIGLLCVQEHVADRPNMASVFLMLSSNSKGESLPLPSQPAFFMGSGNDQSEISSSLGYNSRATTLYSSQSAESEVVPVSQNEASISELYPR